VDEQVKEVMDSGLASEGRLNRFAPPPRPPELCDVSLAELVGELLVRIQHGAFTANETTILLGYQLQASLQSALDVHNNRMSRKRYRDQFGAFYEWVGPPRPKLEGATVVELGCGSINPFGVLFLFLMLGAQRGIAIDLDTIQDFSRSIKVAADCAAMMLIDPGQLVGDFLITREQVLRNIASFDLTKMNAGDPSGIDATRLSYRQEPLASLSLESGQADLVISNAVLEHIEPGDGTIAEMARITRKGGFGIHTIDGSDHRRYGDSSCHPLEFLMAPEGQRLVHGSNRIRPTEFGLLFEQHGFKVMGFAPFETVEIDLALRERFAEPFRSMPNDVLAVIGGKLIVRRV
jgi:SAM-dependent methyltransferase